MPLAEAVRNGGYTTVIRGQRDDEQWRGPTRDGDVVDGVRYQLPLQSWTAEQVLYYLRAVCADDDIPDYYKKDGLATSKHCWNCTGYLDLRANEILALTGTRKSEVLNRLKLIAKAVKAEARYEDLIK